MIVYHVIIEIDVSKEAVMLTRLPEVTQNAQSGQAKIPTEALKSLKLSG